MKLVENKNIFNKSNFFILLPKEKKIKPVSFSSHVKYNELIYLEKQKTIINKNLNAFINNMNSEHTLLWGAKGCGKSTLIKLIIEKISAKEKNIKLVEISSLNIDFLADICYLLSGFDYKFVLFIDDLNFVNTDNNFKYFKSLIEGSILSSFDNIKFFVTSNLRNLSINLNNVENLNDLEIRDIQENVLSLVDRFGCKVAFYDFDQEKYLDVVNYYLKKYSIKMNKTIKQHAIQWSIQKGNFSGRTALQFVNDYLINKN